MRRFTQRKKTISLSRNNRSNKKLFWGAGFVLIVVFFIFLFFKSGFFNIKNIEVDLSNLDCVNDNQIKEVSQIYGQNLLLFDSTHITKNIENKFICVKDVSITKFFPDRAKISVSYREPKAIIFTLKTKEATSSAFLENIATPSADLSTEGFLVDLEGVIFSKNVKDLNIPKIFLYDQSLKIGRKLNGNLQNSFLILEKVKILGFNVLTTQILENFFVIYPTGSFPRIIFKLDERVDSQIASLQLILEKAKIDSSQVGFIDLRFDKPIIKIAPKKNG